jgi:hypothetical protein
MKYGPGLQQGSSRATLTNRKSTVPQPAGITSGESRRRKMMSEPKIVLSWTDGHERKRQREIDPVIDIRSFRGCPGYAQLVVLVGSRTGLSVADILRWLWTEGIERSETWVRRRRWLSQQPGTVNSRGRSNVDGQDERAFKIMRANSTLSVRRLAYVLREHGIRRSSEWVRQNRTRG